MTAEYAALADAARIEAERLQAHWAARGDPDGARLARRLAGLLADERDAARRGELPPRWGGFPLTRFAGDIEWGDEGADVIERLYALQRLWSQT